MIPSGAAVAFLALGLFGDTNEAQKQLCELVGMADCDSRLRYNPRSRSFSFNLTGIDTAQNEGAVLVAQLATSPKVYNLTIGDRYITAAGWKSLGDETIVNNSNTFDPPRFRFEKPAGVRPPTGVDSVVAIDPAQAKFLDSERRRVPLSSIMFHELAEAYAKVDLGKPYIDFEIGEMIRRMVVETPVRFQQGAHNDAVQREIILRNQRPDLQAAGRAGDMLTRE